MTLESKAKLLIDELQPGMYVCELDRPWLETPYLMQGFHINSKADIDELREYCIYVYIDETQSHANYDLRFQEHKQQNHEGRIQTLFPQHKLTQYHDSSDFHEELATAKPIVKKLTDNICELLENVEKNNVLDAQKVRANINPMVNSVVRNPDACIWLARIKNKDSYTYKHSMSACIWAVALGRQIGLPIRDLRDLAIAALLFDIGKLKLPKSLLNKEGKLTKAEFKQIQGHVEMGVRLMEEHGGFNETIIETVACHHERFSGRGYPNQLSGNEIPIFARIAAIVDCYDAITSERPYAKAMSPSVAVRKLYEWRKIDFQSELVEEFIQAIGLYPAGTLVELSTGEVGSVIAEYRTRRLRPQVLLLLNKNKEPLAEFIIINLLETTEDDRGNPLEIHRALEPGAYGLDPESLYI